MSTPPPPPGLAPERFIPLRRSDVVTLCEDRLQHVISADELAVFSRCAALLSALYHHDFHARLERLKELYAPFNPDLDPRMVPALDEEGRDARHKDLTAELEAVLEAANFARIEEADLHEALDEESLFRIRLHVDFSDFAHVLFYRRGESWRRETLRELFGLRRRTLTFRNYDRVVVFVTFKPAEHFAAQDRDDLPFEPGATLVKMFRNVPRADLEMLFPNTEVRMKTTDKLVLGVPAAVSGVVLLTTKLGPTLVLVAALLSFWLGLRDESVVIDQQALLVLGAGLGAIGGFLFQQLSKFNNRKMRFMKALGDSLYFRNLDNNAGVFHRLIDAAEEEECKEALLAWTELLAAGEAGLDTAQLDAAVERRLQGRLGERVDFEVDDALDKLRELGLVRPGDGRLVALGPAEALRRLDDRWDGLYSAVGA